MKLASIFQNHAVLQRDFPLPIWGTAEPGERINVKSAGYEAQTDVDGRGHWLLRLPSIPEGGPHTLTVESLSGRVEIFDLLIGDVWLCSGKSNMEWSLQQCGPEWMSDLEDHPKIRLLTVTTPAKLGRTDRVDGTWKYGTKEALAGFSAAGGFFGLELQRGLGVPVGLICNAWGGSRILAWISREALLQDPSGREEIAYYESLVWQCKRPPPRSHLTLAGRDS